MRSRWIVIMAVMCIAGPILAEEWYLPKPVSVLKKGSGEVGLRAQYLTDEDGALNSRQADLTLFVRYAPLPRLELYLEGPYVYREEERVVAFGLHRFNDQGPGDLYAQATFELWGRTDARLFLGLDVVAPTGQDPFEHRIGLGSGFYRVAPGITALKIIDPAVLFVNVAHQWSFEEEFLGRGRVRPGDDLRVRIGSSFLLNPRFRASVYTTGDFFGHSYVNDVKVAGSDGDLIRFGGGLSWNVTERWKLDYNAAFGITGSASDAVLSLGVSRGF